MLYLLPILSKTLKLTLHFISRRDRCQRRGKERALNSPGRHRLGSQRHLCTASKASPRLRRPPKHRQRKGKRMHEDQTRVRNVATGTRPPQRSPRGLRIGLPGLGRAHARGYGAELLPIPTVRGEPVRGGVAGMFFGGSGGGAAKQRKEGKIQSRCRRERAPALGRLLGEQEQPRSPGVYSVSPSDKQPLVAFFCWVLGFFF